MKSSNKASQSEGSRVGRTCAIRAAFIALSSIAIATESADADVIYLEDFSSAPTIVASGNTNSNLAGTGGTGTNPGEVNAGGWLFRAGGGRSVSHDGANENLSISLSSNTNTHTLIDLSSPLNDPGATSQFRISFDVSGHNGTTDDFNIWAYAGTGVDYNGTDNGHLFFRTFGAPTALIQGRKGATLDSVLPVTAPITGNGTFTSPTFTLNDIGSTGDYLFIGFEGAGDGMNVNIDNLAVTAVPEPSAFLLLGTAAGFLLLRRRRQKAEQLL